MEFFSDFDENRVLSFQTLSKCTIKIKVAENYQDALRFLWRGNTDKEIVDHMMTTSSPEQFSENSPGTAWFRGKFLLDLIRQSQNNQN